MGFDLFIIGLSHRAHLLAAPTAVHLLAPAPFNFSCTVARPSLTLIKLIQRLHPYLNLLTTSIPYELDRRRRLVGRVHVLAIKYGHGYLSIYPRARPAPYSASASSLRPFFPSLLWSLSLCFHSFLQVYHLTTCASVAHFCSSSRNNTLLQKSLAVVSQYHRAFPSSTWVRLHYKCLITIAALSSAQLFVRTFTRVRVSISS